MNNLQKVIELVPASKRPDAISALLNVSNFNMEITEALDESTTGNIPAIEGKACQLFGCRVPDLFTKTRRREVVYARMLMYAYLHRMCGWSQKKTSYRYGRDHSTVVHGMKTIDNLCHTDKDFRAKFETFKQSINEQFTNVSARGESSATTPTDVLLHRTTDN